MSISIGADDGRHLQVHTVQKSRLQIDSLLVACVRITLAGRRVVPTSKGRTGRLSGAIAFCSGANCEVRGRKGFSCSQDRERLAYVEEA